MVKRTWIITEALTQDDIGWLLRSKLDFTPGEQHYLDFVEIGTNKHTKLPGKLDPSTVVTISDKQEIWLKLYFANRAILIAEEAIYSYYD